MKPAVREIKDLRQRKFAKDIIGCMPMLSATIVERSSLLQWRDRLTMANALSVAAAPVDVTNAINHPVGKERYDY
jgi:hypothetical protein